MMGEYGAFIWSAYGIAFAVISGLTVHIWHDMRRQRTLLDDLQARGAPRRGAARERDGSSAGNAATGSAAAGSAR